MKYAKIDGIEKTVSRLVQGTVYFGDNDVDIAFPLYDAVFELGCNTFDTAHGYGGGGCERVLGQWIASRGVRDEVVILDKGAHPKSGDPTPRVTPEDIRSDIQESLERLQTNTIELYILHRDNPAYPVELIVDVLNEQQRAGNIQVFGGSNWSYTRVQQANAYARASNQQPFGASSPQFSLAEMVKPAWAGCISMGGETGKAAREWYGTNQLPLFTWSSLAGGFMTGKFRRDNVDSFSEYFDMVAVNSYCYEDNFRRLDRAEQLAETKGVSLPQLALAYVLQQPLNIFPITGSRVPSEFKTNVAALDIDLSANELAWLNLEADAITS